ncbi:hypothetical protein MSAN_00803900 [Mycena sanguinolenta]|uniref:DUF7704 domain-containing protein n=1 Tax=Mycena sanguinolenta TaxID=230812 RepID=A0A8H6YUK2_9AGAR|nr:hypothetical protein MSAN_00803900 [Mycena sanguinolenta]
MADFPALRGFYQLLFLYIEPLSTMLPALMSWTVVPWRGMVPPPADSLFEPCPSFCSGRTNANDGLATRELRYLLLGLVSSLVFRAARDSLQKDPVAQERIVGSLLTALAIADVTHIAATFAGLPADIRYAPLAWNPMTHGNISIVVVLLSVRIAWFLGINRTSYYFQARKKTA